MKLLHPTMLSILCAILLGCGASDDTSNKTTNVSYEGFWYNVSNDAYLEIMNNTALFRDCSVNNGYRVSESNELVGDTILTESTTYNLLRIDNNLTLSVEGFGKVSKFELQPSLPSVCTGDAIEITFSSPTSATAGIVTSFMVNFDYRLSSKTKGIVHLGFNTDTNNPRDTVLSNSTFLISQAETGSGSLSADIKPVYYNMPDSFKISVILTEDPLLGAPISLSSYDVDVTVTQ